MVGWIEPISVDKFNSNLPWVTSLDWHHSIDISNFYNNFWRFFFRLQQINCSILVIEFEKPISTSLKLVCLQRLVIFLNYKMQLIYHLAIYKLTYYVLGIKILGKLVILEKMQLFIFDNGNHFSFFIFWTSKEWVINDQKLS
jgi:hypothetical protein